MKSNRFLSVAAASVAFAVVTCTAAEQPKLEWTSSSALADGVVYSECETLVPRPLRLRMVKAKLSSVDFTLTGRCEDWGKELKPTDPAKPEHSLLLGTNLIANARARVRRQTVTEFFRATAKERDILCAFPARGTRRPFLGPLLDPHGIFIRDGEIVSDDDRDRGGAVFVVRRNGEVSFERKLMREEYDGVALACSGGQLLRKDGEDLLDASKEDLQYARMAVGLTKKRDTIFFMSIDDGASAVRGNGATKRDVLTLFDTLEATDVMTFSHGDETAFVVKNAQGEGEIFVNPLASKSDKVQQGVCFGVCRKARGGAAKKPDNERKRNTTDEITGRITQAQVSFTKPRKGNNGLKCNIRCELKSDKPRVHRPVLAIKALFDIDGTWKCCDMTMSDRNSNVGHISCRAYPTTAKAISRNQSEVTVKDWAKMAYGHKDKLVFDGCGLSDKAKLLCYRVEFWQHGMLVDWFDSDFKAAKKLGVPEDWHVKGKYAGSINYFWSPDPKKD